jgi:hypothetical protein
MPKFVDKEFINVLLDALIILLNESDTDDKFSFAVFNSNADIAS